MSQTTIRRVRTLAAVGTLAAVAIVTLVATAGGQSGETVTALSIPVDALPEPQQEIFADGDVTFDEYRQAAQATAECVREAGVDLDGPILEDNQTFSFIAATPDEASRTQADQALAECMNTYYSAVEKACADEIHDPAAEEAVNEMILACLQDAGIDATTQEDFRWVVDEHRDSFNRCSTQAIDASP